MTSWVSSSSSMSAKDSRGASVDLLGAGAAPQHRPDPGEDLVEAERLGHVVVAAQRQPGDLVLRGVARGEEQHRACAGRTGAAGGRRRSRRGPASSRRGRAGRGGTSRPAPAPAGRRPRWPPRSPRSAGSPTAARGCWARRPRPAGGPRACCGLRRAAGHGSSGRACGCRRHGTERAPARLRSGLDATCELRLCDLPVACSAGGRHGPAASPVADRVVLGPAQPPAAAQVGADRPDGGRLGAHPGEDVVARRGGRARRPRRPAACSPRGRRPRGAASARRSRPARPAAAPPPGRPPRPAPSRPSWARPRRGSG